MSLVGKRISISTYNVVDVGIVQHVELMQNGLRLIISDDSGIVTVRDVNPSSSVVRIISVVRESDS